MTSFRSTKPLFAAAKDKAPTAQASAPKGENALWRVPEWFPNMEPRLAEGLHVYHVELMKFNVRLNLISRTTEREADETHFADSILAVQLLAKIDLGKEVYDIGSGNGLPGLIFALYRPDIQFFLVESDVRKCEFLKHVAPTMGLKNVTVMNIRLEALKNASIQVALSRGFASLSKALLAANRIFIKGGRFYHLKGSNWSRELADIPSQLISHWQPELVGEYSLPVSQARRAIVSTKRL